MHGTDQGDTKKDSTLHLTPPRAKRSITDMPRFSDVCTALHRRLEYGVNRLDDIRAEMDTLTAHYNRYVDLRREMEQVHSDNERIVGTLGSGYLNQEQYVDYDAGLLRKQLPIWEGIVELLRVNGEMRVPDIHAALEVLEFPKVTRQAVESAINTHPQTFITAKRGREKYVMLKGEHAPATTTAAKNKTRR